MKQKRTCANWHPKIERAIRKAHDDCVRSNEPFKLNLTDLARQLGTSRPTLYKHEPFIEALLLRLRSERRRVDGQAAVDLLKDQLRSRDDTIAELNARNAALIRDLQNVYDHIYGASVTAGELIDAEMRKRSTEDGRCILCDQPITHSLAKGEKVVTLPPRKSK